MSQSVSEPLSNQAAYCVVASEPLRSEFESVLSKRLGAWQHYAPDAACLAQQSDWLEIVDGRALWVSGAERLQLDWLQPSFMRRIQSNRWRQELLIKATGVQKKDYKTALDLTAGMGLDSVLMAASGMSVSAVERHPILATLLALESARIMENSADMAVDISIIQGDARECYFNAILPRADVVYCDPMFPEKKKKALSTKAMQMMKRHVDREQDECGLLDVALKSAEHRVVVKRPVKAPPLRSEINAKLAPSVSFSGKVVRYDVYLMENIRGMLPALVRQTSQ